MKFFYKKWIFSLSVGTVLTLVFFSLDLATRLQPDKPALLTPLLAMILASAAQIIMGLPLYFSLLRFFKDNASRFLFILSSLLMYAFGVWQWQNQIDPTFLMSSTFVLSVATLLFYLEQRSLHSTGLTFDRIHSLRPSSVLKKIKSDFVSTDINQVNQGDVIKVTAGQTIPLDGVIVGGTTSVDDVALTGQSNPKPKGNGDVVIGGSINRDSDILIEVMRAPGEHVLDVIFATLTRCFGKTFPLYKKAQTYALSLSFLGVVAAGVACYVNAVMRHMPVTVSIQRSLMILVACSSFSLAPSILIAASVFARDLFDRGVFVRNNAAVIALAKLHILFFEKTRTLTKGHFEYSQTFIEPGTNLGEFLSTFFSIEAQGTHPLAQAVETHPWYSEIPKHSVLDFKEHAGLGVSGHIHTRTQHDYFAAAGNARLLKRLQFFISRDMKNKMDDLELMGDTVVACGYDKQVRGLVSFADILRPHVRSTLKSIQKLGIEPAIVTGESQEDIEYLAHGLNIQKIFSRCTPEEKAAKIAREKNAGRITGYVGSSSQNLSLEKTDVHLMVDTGPNLVDQNAHVCLMNSDIRQVGWLIKRARTLVHSVPLLTGISAGVMCLQTGLSFAGVVTPEFVVAINLLVNLFLIKSALITHHHQ